MSHSDSVYFALDDNSLEMSALNISIDSTGTGSPSPKSPRSPNMVSDMRKFMKKAEEEDDKATNINDNIHGHIQVPPVLRAIIDTPQFDR